MKGKENNACLEGKEEEKKKKKEERGGDFSKMGKMKFKKGGGTSKQKSHTSVFEFIWNLLHQKLLLVLSMIYRTFITLHTSDSLYICF